MADRRLSRALLLVTLLGWALPASGARVEAQPRERPLVVIDAGHGGVDHGAESPGGLKEKQVALAIARELAEVLRADGGFEVRLTRDSDVLVPLAERARMANRWREDGGPGRPALFVSIHANAHERQGARGVETYFLSEALTDEARRVAARENDAQRFEEGRGADAGLAFILNDLRRNLYLRESSEGAALFQRRLVAIHDGPDRGVKQAGFVVLEGAFMPAVLVELGFITNPRDEAMLASGAYQRLAARELAAAVGDFFARTSAASSSGR
jgi:N-acetylmuramoyl-L-alanine amidase